LPCTSRAALGRAEKPRLAAASYMQAGDFAATDALAKLVRNVMAQLDKASAKEAKAAKSGRAGKGATSSGKETAVKGTGAAMMAGGSGAAVEFHCAQCGCGALQACARCRAVHYCGKVCQSAHWKAGHKQLCVPPGEFSAAEAGAVVK